MLLIGVAAVVSLVLFVWFYRLERRGDPATIVIFLFALVIVDSALYGGSGQDQYGLFRPGLEQGPFRSRLPEIVIPLALAARVAAHRFPRRVSVTTLWWWSFFAWMLLAAVVGQRSGNDFEQVLFQGKAILYVGGAMALAAGVPASDYLGRRGLSRLVLGVTPLAVLVMGINLLKITFTGGPPGLKVVNLGISGALPADPATVFSSLGLLGILMELARERPRPRLVLASLLLLCAPLVGEQRAALLGMGTSILVVAVALLGRTGHRRVAVTPTQVGLAALVGVLAIFVPTFVKATSQPTGIVVPFADDIAEAFGGQGNQLSAESRLNQWREAGEQITERPVRGWGLGKTFTYFDPGLDEFFTADITHNIAVDLTLRMGLVGLALFGVAITSSLLDGWRSWRSRADTKVAALALACTAAVVGLLMKGMVESIFEKYLLATLLGLLLGVLRSASTAPPPERAQDGEASPHERVLAAVPA